MDICIEDKLRLLFLKLQSISDINIEDDTVLQKLQTSFQNYIEKKEEGEVLHYRFLYIYIFIKLIYSLN